ncbi:VWA domain-containing protein [Balneola sp. MJW-20]|uniref:VWA domain-containing protein n=1 Tax=Gracilimonas aurantiaca TaxID=3234185 RepID=UPI00346547DE
MLTNIKALLASNIDGESTGSVANCLGWIRHTGFFAILAMTIVFTGCDTPVMDNGSTLSSTDIMVMQKTGDNGDLSPVCEVTQIDVSLVLDVSGSMSGSPLQAAKDGAKALVATLNESDQGTLVSFSTFANRNLDLTIMDAAGQAALDAAIDGLTAGGLTYISNGIIFGAEELLNDESLFSLTTSPSGNARETATKVMVLLSDGYTFDPAATDAAATTAKGAGIRIFTIAIEGADEAGMAGYASSPDDAFTTADLSELTTIFTEIAQSICPTPVAIDIKPGSDPNSINPEKKGVTAVAVFGSAEFDAASIDPETVRFGSLDTILAGEGSVLAHPGGHLEDVNGDGFMDFVGHFPIEGMGFTDLDEFGWLIGDTYDGDAFAGSDAVRIVLRGKPVI